MALTSNDETDLLLPLYRGVMESPRFGQFLERLRRRTGAAHVSLDLQRNSTIAPHRSPVRPYRVYTLAELAERDPSIADTSFADLRAVRIPVNSRLDGILTLARAAPCTAADSALLSNLAPYVQTALSALERMHRARFEAALSNGGLARSGTGWMLFDANARVLAIEPETARNLADQTGFTPRVGEHLRTIFPDAGKKLSETASRFAREADSLPDSIVLCTEPHIDAVLIPTPRNSSLAEDADAFPDAAMVAYCRFETGGTSERSAHFARLFSLPPREAELAIALADGHSISEAATAMGLTLETARNYSKRLYAQLGVRGQTELVRLIHRSSAVLV